MADLNAIRQQLLELIHPAPLGTEETLDLVNLFEEWATWSRDEEVDIVCATLEETRSARFLRLLIQYFGTVQTPRALFHLDRLVRARLEGIVDEAIHQIEKNKSRGAQLVLLQMVETEPALRPKTLPALERAATLEALEDYEIKLVTTTDTATQVEILSIFRKLKAAGSVPLILDILERSQVTAVQSQALFSLGHLGKPKHRRVFERFLKSPEMSLRRAALFGLHRACGADGMRSMLAHLPLETDAGLQRELLTFVSRMNVEPPTDAVECLAQWAAHAESPSQRQISISILSAWCRSGSVKPVRRLFEQALKRDPMIAVVLLQTLNDVRAIAPAQLWQLTQSHSQTLVRVSALEALGAQGESAFLEGGVAESMHALLEDIDPALQYASALVTGDYPSGLIEPLDISSGESAAVQAFLFTLSKKLERTTMLPEEFYERLQKSVHSTNRSTRFLTAQILAMIPTLRSVVLCQNLAMTDPEERVAQEGLRGILAYVVLPNSSLVDALDVLVGQSRFSRRLRKLLENTELFPHSTRRALALRLSAYLANHPILQRRPLDRQAAHWLVIYRMLCDGFEEDLMRWMQKGTIPRIGCVPALVTLISLLHDQTRTMDFDWITSLMEDKDRWIREQAARLLLHHFPWTPRQTVSLLQWYVNEPEGSIRVQLHAVIQKNTSAVVSERRAG